MFSEFKAFIARGNVLDLAVGVIIGAAFGKIVSSLTDDIIMPIVGAITGGVDFSSRYMVLNDAVVPAGASLAAARAAGANAFAYGAFITAILNFLILAFIIFMIVKQANKYFTMTSAAPAGPTEIDLLTEIRDNLKK
jgi:large conductance mechanosensitive channel